MGASGTDRDTTGRQKQQQLWCGGDMSRDNRPSPRMLLCGCVLPDHNGVHYSLTCLDDTCAHTGSPRSSCLPLCW